MERNRTAINVETLLYWAWGTLPLRPTALVAPRDALDRLQKRSYVRNRT